MKHATAFSESPGLRVPIFQGPVGSVAGPELAAAGADLQGEAAAAARKLQAALERFKDARPASLTPPPVPGEKKRKNK